MRSKIATCQVYQAVPSGSLFIPSIAEHASEVSMREETRNSTLHTLIQAILNFQEEEAFDLVREIRTCESLDAVAERIVAKEHGLELDDADDQSPFQNGVAGTPTFETQLYGKMGDLRLDEGSVRHIGGTSNLPWRF